MKKFLVIQTAFIGDVVLATGIIEKLHQYYPEARIDFLVRKGNEGLLEGHPFLNQVLIWVKKENKIRNLVKLLFRVRNAHYDAVINVQRFAATGFLTAFSGAAVKIGFDKNPFSWLFTKKIPHVISDSTNRIHEIDRNQELIKGFTDNIPAKPRLYPTAADTDAVRELKKSPYIVIAPASVYFTKQYPKEKWVEFINRVPQTVSIYLIGAPGDIALCNAIKENSTHPGVMNLCGKYSFLESAALQKDALMNYVNDSAPMHFASSVNAPVTAVYCSTIPSFGFGPLSDSRFIVETTIALSCRPCGLHGRTACPEGHFKCALTIREEQLLNTLNG